MKTDGTGSVKPSAVKALIYYFIFRFFFIINYKLLIFIMINIILNYEDGVWR